MAYNLTWKSSSYKTWQISLLFLKPLQMQNLKRKKVGGQGTLCPPPSGKVGAPHQIAPMLACAAEKLSLFRDSDLANSIPHDKMLDRSCWPSFAGSRNLKDTKNHFIETKVYKITESVTPHQTLLQHQVDCVYLLSRDVVSGVFKGRRDGDPLRHDAHKFSFFLVKKLLSTHIMYYKADHK